MHLVSVVPYSGLLVLLWIVPYFIPYGRHVGSLPNIPDQTKETRLGDDFIAPNALFT